MIGEGAADAIEKGDENNGTGDQITGALRKGRVADQGDEEEKGGCGGTRERRKMPMENAPKRIAERRNHSRSLKSVGDEVGTKARIVQRIARRMADAKASLIADCALRRRETFGQTQDLNRLIENRRREMGQADGD